MFITIIICESRYVELIYLLISIKSCVSGWNSLSSFIVIQSILLRSSVLLYLLICPYFYTKSSSRTIAIQLLVCVYTINLCIYLSVIIDTGATLAVL